MKPDVVVSVIIPCLNEHESIDELYTRTNSELNNLCLPYEIIFVDDGSTDGTAVLLKALSSLDPHCQAIILRRNCGKAAALHVGFSIARGEYILTMDADLQDDPAEIPRFLEALQRADVVSGWKVHRRDPVGKTLPSKVFNALVRKVTGVSLHDVNCGWKGYRRNVILDLSLYGELHRFIPILAAARGFSIAEIPVTHYPRRIGTSKYGRERFLRGLFDLLTVVYLTKYRDCPLHFFGGCGLGMFVCGIIAGGTLWGLSITLPLPPSVTFLTWVLPLVGMGGGMLLGSCGLLAESLRAILQPLVPMPPVAEQLSREVAETIEAAPVVIETE